MNQDNDGDGEDSGVGRPDHIKGQETASESSGADPSPASKTPEPAAWRYRTESGLEFARVKRMDIAGLERVEPLFTADQLTMFLPDDPLSGSSQCHRCHGNHKIPGSDLIDVNAGGDVPCPFCDPEGYVIWSQPYVENDSPRFRLDYQLIGAVRERLVEVGRE